MLMAAAAFAMPAAGFYAVFVNGSGFGLFTAPLPYFAYSAVGAGRPTVQQHFGTREEAFELIKRVQPNSPDIIPDVWYPIQGLPQPISTSAARAVRASVLDSTISGRSNDVKLPGSHPHLFRRQIMFVTGARPNIMKVAPMVHAIRRRNLSSWLDVQIVHTGQHSDMAMAGSFFRDFGIRPDIELHIAPGSPSKQSASIVVELEQRGLFNTSTRPDVLVVVGDVTSTIAAALAAMNARVPVWHVEAGLRAFDRELPEEINRIVVGDIACVHFAVEPTSVRNLVHEGIDPGAIHLVGNLMIDSLFAHLPMIRARAIHRSFNLTHSEYIVVEFHRNFNCDRRADMHRIFSLVKELGASGQRVVWSVHPRVHGNVRRLGLEQEFASATSTALLLPPLSYMEFIGLVEASLAVVTDSGGLQEETTALGRACVTVRPSLESLVTLHAGTNVLAWPPSVQIVQAALRQAIAKTKDPERTHVPYWDGRAAERFADVAVALLSKGRPCETQESQLTVMRHHALDPEMASQPSSLHELPGASQVSRVHDAISLPEQTQSSEYLTGTTATRHGHRALGTVLLVAWDLPVSAHVNGGRLCILSTLRLLALTATRVVFITPSCGWRPFERAQDFGGKLSGMSDFPIDVVEVVSLERLCTRYDICMHSCGSARARMDLFSSLPLVARALDAKLVVVRMHKAPERRQSMIANEYWRVLEHGFNGKGPKLWLTEFHYGGPLEDTETPALDIFQKYGYRLLVQSPAKVARLKKNNPAARENVVLYPPFIEDSIFQVGAKRIRLHNMKHSSQAFTASNPLVICYAGAPLYSARSAGVLEMIRGFEPVRAQFGPAVKLVIFISSITHGDTVRAHAGLAKLFMDVLAGKIPGVAGRVAVAHEETLEFWTQNCSVGVRGLRCAATQSHTLFYESCDGRGPTLCI